MLTEEDRTTQTARSPWSGPGGRYVVAVNDEEQHALWPATLALPAGWQPRSAPMRRQACLTAVAAAWKDIIPASVRATGRAARPGNGTRQGDGCPPGKVSDLRFVHAMFDEQASRRPDAVAVTCGGIRLTYRQLARSANQMAHHLGQIRAGPESLVGVCVERGIDTIQCLLAILKAGAAYLPLDPALPASRLAEMCDQTRPAVILADRADAGAFAGIGAQVMPARNLRSAAAGEPATTPAVSLHMGNMAYVIYTSGSTGHPKAVAVNHGSLAHLIQEISPAYQLSPGDRVVQLASLGFDTSVEQTLVTLAHGATLMLPPAGVVAPTDLLHYLGEERVTVIDLTPAYWHQLLAITEPADRRLRDVRLMITGGDMADWRDCRAAMRAAPGARLVNAYGLTETAITSTLFEAGADSSPPEQGRVPVGRPLRHVQVLVLDENLQAAPPGTTGEVYISGESVARGYLGQPGLTAERFVPDPHSAVPGTRMYRTGDLGRWLGGQCLEVTGRADRQMKVSGFRVEPAEVERALTEHPDITEAAVTALEVTPGNLQLTAYYRHRPRRRPAATETSEPLSVAALRAFVADRVPSYMLPAEFIPRHDIPRMPGGEVDWRQLEHPAAKPRRNPAGELCTPLQAGISQLWSKILKIQAIGLDDDFFSLGGNSVLAAEMLAHARGMFGISASDVRPLTRCLLRDPTVRGFSEAMRAAQAGALDTAGAAHRTDFAREAELGVPVRLDGGPPPAWRRPRRVLLTGATGFFGIHLLRELLTSTAAEVHCLVRAGDPTQARQRIAQAAERYEVGGLAMDRVVPVTGDLAEPGLGLPASRFADLAHSLDGIYHAGALVNFTYPYAELRAANVSGTRELIRLAGRYRRIPVHYVSSTAVLAGFGAMGVRAVSEDTPLAYADHLCLGYVETKFVAEELLRNASHAGLPVTIYRPLDIVGDHRTGAWNTASEMCAMVRFITDTGLAPDIDLPLDFVPADTCAAAIAYIASHAEPAGVTYHLSSPEHTLLESLVMRLRRHGFAIEEIAYRDWVHELMKHAADNPAHPMAPFIPLFADRSPDSGLTTAEMYFEHIFPSYTRSNTERALAGSPISFPVVDDSLLDLHIDRLVATGYLRDPYGKPGCQAPGGNWAG